MDVRIFEVPDCESIGDILHFESLIRNAGGVVMGHIFNESDEEGWIRYHCPTAGIQSEVQRQLEAS